MTDMNNCPWLSCDHLECCDQSPEHCEHFVLRILVSVCEP